MASYGSTSDHGALPPMPRFSMPPLVRNFLNRADPCLDLAAIESSILAPAITGWVGHSYAAAFVGITISLASTIGQFTLFNFPAYRPMWIRSGIAGTVAAAAVACL